MPSRIVCFVCGSLGGEYQLRSRPHEGHAYFPFLEHHDPPKGSRIPGPDGIVDSCRVCYAFLTQQWETYERTNTPALKRLYWLKRLDDGQFTGAEMKLQGEYMAQVMGLQYQPSCGDGCTPLSPDSRDEFSTGQREPDYTHVKKQDVDEGALDLSVPVKTEPKVKSKKSGHEMSEVSTSRASIDHLSFICYTCGNDSQGIAAKLISSIYHVANKPYFPFLTKVTPPRGATPLNEQGVCQVCDHCFSSLCHQWLTYEQQGTPNGARIFKVNGVFFSNDSSIVAGRDTKSSVKDVCYLCSQAWPSSKMCPLYTAPISGRKDHMYFPFIRELRRPNGAHPLNPDGSVQVCLSCYSNLQLQWRHFESEKVPYLHRRYSLLPPSTSAAVSQSVTLDSDLKLRNHGLEDVLKHSAISLTKDTRKSPGLLKTFTNSTVMANSTSKHEHAKPYNNEVKLPSTNPSLSIPHPLQQAGERPKKVCFVCGEKCLVTKAQLLHIYPPRSEGKSYGVLEPFFPFLANYEPAPGSEPPSEEGIVISCSYCYYSLLNQWKDFEELRMPSDGDRFKRKYRLHDFVCFVCGMTVPRKKLRTLEVQKFLFLREHKAPSNALVMWGGHGVGACSSCHFSLTHQYAEFERLGLPIELRKYNWTVQHHPDENKETHNNLQRQEETSANSDENFVTEGTESYPSLSSSGKLTLSTYSASGTRLPMTAPPSTFHSPNSTGNSYLSSFSAALRKLAYQTKDLSDDSPAKHSMSPSSHTSSRSATPKRSHSLAFSSKPNQLSASNQTQNSLESHRRSVDRTQTNNMDSPHDHGGRSVIEQHLASHDFSQGRDTREELRRDSRDEIRRDSRDSSRLTGRESREIERNAHLAAAQVRIANSELYARDFPGYLTEEEAASIGLAIPLRIDPAAYMAAYHPFYLQQQAMVAQSPFRLDDPMLLEQYRMFQSSFLPFPGGAYLPGPPRPVDMHSMLAAAQHYPLELLQQQYAYINSSHPLLHSRFGTQANLLDRNCLAEEKSHLLSERHKEHERLLDWEVKHEPGFSPDRDYKKLKDSEIFAQDRHKEKPDYPSHRPESTTSHLVGESSVVHGNFSSVADKQSHTRGFHSSDFKPSPKLDFRESTLERSPHHNFTVSPNKTSQSFSVPLSHDDYLKLHLSKSSSSTSVDRDNHSPSKVMKLSPSSQTVSSQDLLQDNLQSHPLLHQQHPTLPSSAHTASSLNSSNNHIKNPRCSSGAKTLFRPFDDCQTSESPTETDLVKHPESDFLSSANHSLVYSQTPTALDNHTAILSIPTVKPFSKSSQPSTDSTAFLQSSEKINPLHVTNVMPSPNKLDRLSYYVQDKVERFDFKSLARECSASSANCDPAETISSDKFLSKADSQRELLSKLDHEQQRLKKLRKTNSSDVEDLEERNLVRLTMIERATPIPLEAPKNKLELLEYLGITTWAKKKELQLEKEVRRRQHLRLPSVSPIHCESESTPEFTIRQEHPLVLSQPSNSKLPSQPEKSKFLCDLGLVPFPENDKSVSSTDGLYVWPGVETVIDSYHKHNEDVTEQHQEVHLLRERSQQLKAENERLAQVSEAHNQHMAMLLLEHQRMEQTRIHCLFAIDFLKKSCQNLKKP
ncbi:uncharacterized protein LOC106061017 isoform X1 [Biomphalaria glabrata]|uniref:Uncharacterized protein LOC106061017 isoform X1 n=1 Tax=Biomphalaria glabrata TaxID=6526 RepID=A0A9W3ATB9_BIOGL|nr:uncharacterized protein LOC106061017 isoform X1 [Biomphalaria glabrata]XP_055890454.1 uncharacterized protein LOC106061017 isoform X1 [Biomphalaria glabrata]